MSHRCEVRVDVAAIEHNTRRMVQAAPTSAVCAVVKADGYGHGMVQSARAALAGGAGWLAVATAEEGARLRETVSQTPILVLGALTNAEAEQAIAARLDVTAWDPRFVTDLAATAARLGLRGRVHVKLDTGLGRLGTRDPAQASAVASAIANSDHLELVAGWTHFATADEYGDEFFDLQLDRFSRWAEEMRATHPEVLLHAANSAAALRDRRSHFDIVRCGVALYGLDPFGDDPCAQGLRPAMEVIATIGAIKDCAAGESTGYGRRFVADRDTVVATVPIGYGDGYRRGLSGVAPVIIGGRRYRLCGTVSMDNVTVDLGPDGHGVSPGQVAQMLGGAGQPVTAEELAALLGTINYEITCAFGSRPTRTWHRDGGPAA